MIRFTLPLRIHSMQNQSSNFHAVARQRKAHRTGARVVALAYGASEAALPCVVTLCRVAPRKLDDHDTLRYGFKGVVDGIADALGTTIEELFPVVAPAEQAS